MTIGAVPAAVAPAAQGSEVNPKVMKAAQDFEAMTIGQMLQPMFDTVDQSGGLFGGGAGESNFKPMLVTEMAKQVESHGGFGLAEGIYQQMLKMQEKKP